MKLHRVAPSLFTLVLASAAPSPAQNLELTKVVAQKMDRNIQLPGEFLPFQRVSVFARVASFVQQVHVDRGSVVKRGQPLVTLTAPELAAQVAESKQERRRCSCSWPRPTPSWSAPGRPRRC